VYNERWFNACETELIGDRELESAKCGWILEIAEGATNGRSDRKEFVKLVKKARSARG